MSRPVTLAYGVLEALDAVPASLPPGRRAPLAAQRLPATVVPEHYDLAFDVDLAAARFGGVETIGSSSTEPSRRIVLHALEIQFQEVTIAAGGTTQRASVSLNAPTQTAALVGATDDPGGPGRDSHPIHRAS